MNREDIAKLVELDLFNKPQQQIFVDALEAIGREASEALGAGNFERANAILDKADEIMNKSQYSALILAVGRLSVLWSRLIDAERQFAHFNVLSERFATAYDPTNELNKIANTKDNEQ